MCLFAILWQQQTELKAPHRSSVLLWLVDTGTSKSGWTSQCIPLPSPVDKWRMSGFRVGRGECDYRTLCLSQGRIGAGFRCRGTTSLLYHRRNRASGTSIKSALPLYLPLCLCLVHCMLHAYAVGWKPSAQNLAKSHPNEPTFFFVTIMGLQVLWGMLTFFLKKILIWLM